MTDKCIKKTIYFVGIWEWIGDESSTDFFRGIYPANHIKNVNEYQVKFIKFSILEKLVNNQVKFENNIFILVRGNICNINQYIDIFSKIKEKNILIHDILDIYQLSSNWYTQQIYIHFENLFDYLFVNSNFMINELKKYIKPKMFILHHSYDYRFVPTNNVENKVYYFGTPIKLQIRDKKDYTIWTDGPPRNMNPCIQFTFLYSNHPYYFNHNTTKLATALGNNSILVCNKIPIMVEILGDDYPFFCDENENSLHETIKKAKETIINNDLYQNYLDKVKDKKILLSPETMINNYKLIITKIITE